METFGQHSIDTLYMLLTLASLKIIWVYLAIFLFFYQLNPRNPPLSYSNEESQLQSNFILILIYRYLLLL